MRKVISIILIAFGASPAFAQWTQIGADGTTTQYIDFSKTQRGGSQVKIWTIIDYNEPQKALGIKFRSMIIQEEYDCKNSLRRTLSGVAYSERMASGTVAMHETQSSNWQAIPRDSEGELFLNIACANNK
jgi:hypothetical protein